MCINLQNSSAAGESDHVSGDLDSSFLLSLDLLSQGSYSKYLISPGPSFPYVGNKCISLLPLCTCRFGFQGVQILKLYLCSILGS